MTGRIIFADSTFSLSRYTKSASIFASTSLPVEDTFLRFLPLNQPDALKELLITKLENLKEEDSTQIIVLTFWLLDLILETLQSSSDSNEKDLLRSEIRTVLSDRKISEAIRPVNHKVYSLLSSFGEKDTLLFFAEQCKDYPVIVEHYVREKMFDKAIAQIQTSVSE